jgi:SPP1 family predicted phage head-tail adaptor
LPLKRLSFSRESIGGMSRQITLYLPGSRAADGGNTPPSPFFTTWANIQSLRGMELDRADQIAQQVDLTLRIPYQTGITLDMIVGFEDERWQITYIEDQDRRHVFLDLYCAEMGQNPGQQA